jgi:hypothetical protein
MARGDYYRLRAEECLVASRACSDPKEAAQLTLMAASYLDLSEVSERVFPTHEEPRHEQQSRLQLAAYRQP